MTAYKLVVWKLEVDGRSIFEFLRPGLVMSKEWNNIRLKLRYWKFETFSYNPVTNRELYNAERESFSSFSSCFFLIIKMTLLFWWVFLLALMGCAISVPVLLVNDACILVPAWRPRVNENEERRIRFNIPDILRESASPV